MSERASEGNVPLHLSRRSVSPSRSWWPAAEENPSRSRLGASLANYNPQPHRYKEGQSLHDLLLQRDCQLACNMTPPTCVSFLAPPFVSFCGCTQPCSFHSASPGWLLLGPACVSSPACSSAAGSQSELHPPLMDATSVIIKQKNSDVQMSCRMKELKSGNSKLMDTVK